MRLHYFKKDEFGDWWDDMSPELLVKLDVLRHQWGEPIRISRANGAVGRKDNSNSQHNIKRWGEIRAVDILPAGLFDEMDVNRFVLAATECGFTGMGFYPDWNSGRGFHLDVRSDRDVGNPATWGAVNNSVGKQTYTTLAAAMLQV